MAAAGAIIGLVGVGMQVYGAMEEGEAKAKQAERDAQLRRTQKMELEYRVQQNILMMQKESEQLLSSSVARYGSNGLAVMENIYTSTAQRIEKMQREGAFQARMIEEGAKTSSLLADEYSNAGDRNALAYGIGGLSNFANNVAYMNNSSGGSSNVDNSGSRDLKSSSSKSSGGK